VILADENLPESIVAALEEAGFTVVHIADIDAGAEDEVVLQHAVARGLEVSTRAWYWSGCAGCPSPRRRNGW